MSCPPVAGVDVLADESECRLRSENALRWIEGNTTIKTVVMGMFGYYGESTDVAQAHRDGPVGPSKVRINGFHDRETKTRLFSHGLRNAVGRLIAAGKTVVIVIDVPELPFAPADCFLTPRFRIATNECVVPLDAVAERQRSFREIVSGIVEAYPTVRVVDPLPVLCGPDGCGPGTRAAPTYRDSHHLSTLGSAKVGRQILDEVNR
jgi:hypothetical protein